METIEEVLSPLYLPSSEGKLHISTNLMYGDTSAYRGRIQLNIQKTAHAELQIHSHEFEFTALELCSVIPESIRPKKMSEMCEQQIISSCDEVPDSEVTTKIKKTLKVSLVPEATLKILMHYIKDETIKDSLKSFISNFLSNITVHTLRNLKTTIIFKQTQDQIGNTTVNFFLQTDNPSQCQLYLDSKIQYPFNENVVHEIAEYILSQTRTIYHQHIPSDTFNQIKTMLIYLFKVQNDSQVEKLLEKEGISIQSTDMEFPLPELGKDIPACWHHRLDQDTNNIFYPTEWVGYEDRENHIIFVQIGYPILPDEHTDFENIPRLQMRYQIFTREDDIEGINVSGLDLLKFIRGKAKVTPDPNHHTDDDASAIMIYNAEGAPPIDSRFDEEDLKRVKEEICQKLREIWQLSEDLRKKALRRMYLKWHPDKNPDQPLFAEEVFKFMLSQIQQLEKGEMIGPDTYSNSHRDKPNFKSSFFDFSSWESTARTHYHWFKREQTFYSHNFDGRHQSYRTNFGSFFNASPCDKNTREGWRWVAQANVDFKMLELNNIVAQEHPELKGYGLVCFLAHQVCEKALQGGVYAICGNDKRKITDHNLSRRAYMIQARKLGETIGLIHRISDLEKYYLEPRYPNRWNDFAIPADHYSSQQASEAVESAKFVLELVKTLMPPQE